MKADCIAVIETIGNEALWTCEATGSLEKAAQSLEVFRTSRATSHLSLMLVKSYSDEKGDEVLLELMTPWADAYLAARKAGDSAPEKAVIEIWHETNPKFGFGPIPETLDPLAFTHRADMLVPVSTNQEVALDICFSSSQNIHSGWNPCKSSRSSSIGDVFVLKTPAGTQAYLVTGFGFKKISFVTSPEALFRLSTYRAEAYLARSCGSEVISAVYDDDDMLQSALITLIPEFEYPDWSHKTIGDARKFIGDLQARQLIS